MRVEAAKTESRCHRFDSASHSQPNMGLTSQQDFKGKQEIATDTLDQLQQHVCRRGGKPCITAAPHAHAHTHRHRHTQTDIRTHKHAHIHARLYVIRGTQQLDEQWLYWHAQLTHALHKTNEALEFTSTVSAIATA